MSKLAYWDQHTKCKKSQETSWLVYCLCCVLLTLVTSIAGWTFTFKTFSCPNWSHFHHPNFGTQDMTVYKKKGSSDSIIAQTDVAQHGFMLPVRKRPNSLWNELWRVSTGVLWVLKPLHVICDHMRHKGCKERIRPEEEPLFGVAGNRPVGLLVHGAPGCKTRHMANVTQGAYDEAACHLPGGRKERKSEGLRK